MGGSRIDFVGYFVFGIYFWIVINLGKATMKKDIFSSKESEKEELKKKAREVLNLEFGQDYVDALIDYSFSMGRLDRMFEELRDK